MSTFITRDFYTQSKREEEEIMRMVAEQREHMTPEERQEKEKRRKEAYERMWEKYQREKESERFVGNREKRKKFLRCVKRALRAAKELDMDVRVTFNRQKGSIVFETGALCLAECCGTLESGRRFLTLLQEAEEVWMDVESDREWPLLSIQLNFSLADVYTVLPILDV